MRVLHGSVAGWTGAALMALGLSAGCGGDSDDQQGSGQETTGAGGGASGAGGGATGATSGADGTTSSSGVTSGAGGATSSSGATSGAGGATSGSGATSGAGGATSSAGAGGGGDQESPGFSVRGRFLYDRCGEKVLLRGINEMVVWLSSGPDGLPEFAEIAKTGANAVRIVWLATESSAGLDQAITNALAQKLIPIVELHDATGKWDLLPSLVDYWTRADVVAVIKKHEQSLLVNIGNEVGDQVDNAAWEAGYKQAITRMRGAGITVPLVIDASKWGQNIDQLQAVGPALVKHDPNILLSVHMWWTDGSGATITKELQESVALNLPLMVGEFAQHAVYECGKHPFDYKTLLAKSVELEVGWLAWSWGAVKNSDCQSDGPFDMTTNGTFAGLTGWGREVAVTDPNSIQNTSVRPRSIETGSCR
ncbi:cellulase family glycosylhydrolase [Sorangium atrum]|uniref:Cellulase family glycosylhydrolase n=1 Tax=Sorangium atrum TaxID=2995308 RepID=A0ABT5CBL7_9BACT|nr:cellulase family glycosylhydrolase [Sorangium aterium]MDC0683824.1 cellulase family glycosylhydrolase [Sorangium aterium]